MDREFVMTKEFDACWRNLGLDDDDLKQLQSELLISPDAGDRIPRAGGIRKYRFALEGRGKRGGARICYLDIPSAERLFLLIAYAKNEKQNITMQERHRLKQKAMEIKAASQGGL